MTNPPSPLVERLKDWARSAEGGTNTEDLCQILRDAAAEIERLETALRDIDNEPYSRRHNTTEVESGVVGSMRRIARAALARKEAGGE